MYLTILLVISLHYQSLVFAWEIEGESDDRQHVAPGVPPQAYPPSQQEEVRFHEPSEFAKQSNQDQVNYQNTVQTDESHHGHGDHKHGIGEVQDKEHMKQHEQEDYVDFSKMTEAEIIMHHFKQFDHDKDGMVDGLEVLKQIQRQNAEHNAKATPEETKKVVDTEQIVSETVDQSLKAYDENDDGYINYGEFYRTHIRLTKDIKKKKEEKANENADS